MPVDRRLFLQTRTAALTSFALGGHGWEEEEQAATLPGRSVLPINQNWKCSRVHEKSMLERDYDDSSFERVTLPHTDLAQPWHQFDPRSYQFVSVYRRELDLPTDVVGRRVFLDFDGAMTATTIWLNGVRVGTYNGVHTPFSLEITQLIGPSLVAPSGRTTAVWVRAGRQPGTVRLRASHSVPGSNEVEIHTTAAVQESV